MAVHVCPRCGARVVGAERCCTADDTPLDTAHEDDPLVGRRIGAYTVRRRLAKGGMGRVFLALRDGAARPCALKVLDGEITQQPDALQRFLREAGNQARLRGHPNICELHEFGRSEDGLVFIAMEYVEGESLRALLRRSPGFHLPPARVADIVRQAAAGLTAAHAIGLVHRDLKPDNIMLGAADAGGDLVKLIDFGIAKRPKDRLQRVTRSGVTVGTPEFMSPEQLAADAVGPASDIYSLGLVSFLMFAGALPFDGNTPDAMTRRMAGQLRMLRDVRPDAGWPAALEQALAHALAPAPEDRYASADAFARDVARAVDDWKIPLAGAHTSSHPAVSADPPGRGAGQAEAPGATPSFWHRVRSRLSGS